MMPNGTPPEPTAAEDAGILFPDVDVTVRDPDTGEKVTLTVREFRFLEGLRLAGTIRPLVESLGVAVPESENEDIDLNVIADAMGAHADIWITCIAQATGRDAGWIGRLSDDDGQALSATMWSANRIFFGRRLIEDVRRRREAGPSPSPTSSMPSSAPATGMDTATSPSN